jgi:hypothetical protein
MEKTYHWNVCVHGATKLSKVVLQAADAAFFKNATIYVDSVRQWNAVLGNHYLAFWLVFFPDAGQYLVIDSRLHCSRILEKDGTRKRIDPFPRPPLP